MAGWHTRGTPVDGRGRGLNLRRAFNPAAAEHAAVCVFALPMWIVLLYLLTLR